MGTASECVTSSRWRSSRVRAASFEVTIKQYCGIFCPVHLFPFYLLANCSFCLLNGSSQRSEPPECNYRNWSDAPGRLQGQLHSHAIVIIELVHGSHKITPVVGCQQFNLWNDSFSLLRRAIFLNPVMQGWKNEKSSMTFPSVRWALESHNFQSNPPSMKSKHWYP